MPVTPLFSLRFLNINDPLADEDLNLLEGTTSNGSHLVQHVAEECFNSRSITPPSRSSPWRFSRRIHHRFWGHRTGP